MQRSWGRGDITVVAARPSGRGFEHGGQKGHQRCLPFDTVLREAIVMYYSWNLKKRGIRAWEDLVPLPGREKRCRSSFFGSIWSCSGASEPGSAWFCPWRDLGQWPLLSALHPRDEAGAAVSGKRLIWPRLHIRWDSPSPVATSSRRAWPSSWQLWSPHQMCRQIGL